MKKSIVFMGLFFMCLFSVSCVGTQRLRMEDIKSDKYFYKSYALDKPISEIEEIIFEYGYRCRPLPEFVVQPVKKKKAYMAWKRYFTAKPTIIGLIDFVENGDATSTKVNSYWYYTTIDGVISDKIISIIRNPEKCVESSAF